MSFSSAAVCAVLSSTVRPAQPHQLPRACRCTGCPRLPFIGSLCFRVQSGFLVWSLVGFASHPTRPRLLWRGTSTGASGDGGQGPSPARQRGSHWPRVDCIGRLRFRPFIFSVNTSIFRVISHLDVCYLYFRLFSLFFLPF